MIKEIAFTSYPAKDVERLRDWYRDTLGLKFGGPYAEDGVLKYDEANVGNGYFSVMTTAWHEGAPGSAAGIVFEVADIEAAKRELDGRGVKTEDIYDTPVCRLFSVRDPEGNKISLHQITKPH